MWFFYLKNLDILFQNSHFKRYALYNELSLYT